MRRTTTTPREAQRWQEPEPMKPTITQHRWPRQQRLRTTRLTRTRNSYDENKGQRAPPRVPQRIAEQAWQEQETTMMITTMTTKTGGSCSSSSGNSSAGSSCSSSTTIITISSSSSCSSSSASTSSNNSIVVLCGTKLQFTHQHLNTHINIFKSHWQFQTRNEKLAFWFLDFKVQSEFLKLKLNLESEITFRYSNRNFKIAITICELNLMFWNRN